MTTTPNPTAEQAERLSMEVLNEYRKIAAWLEAQAATRGPVGDTMHGLAAEALTNLIEHEYSRHKIPLYGMLDLWMALGVTSHPEFDEFYDEHGYAETWSRLLDGVRRLRRAHGWLSEGAPSEEQIERAAKALYDTEPIRYSLSIHYEKVGEPKPWAELNEATKGVYRRKVIKTLTAAGVAPQGQGLAARIREILDRDEEEDARAGAYRDPESRRLQVMNRTIMRIEAVLNEAAPQEPSCGNAQCVGECGEHGVNLALEKPSRSIHEPDANCVYCVRCGGSWPCQPTPSPDREELIAEAKTLAWKLVGEDDRSEAHSMLYRLIDALAAQPVLDPEKVAEVIRNELRKGEYATTPDELPYAATSRWIARVLCEAAKRGDLT